MADTYFPNLYIYQFNIIKNKFLLRKERLPLAVYRK